MLPTLRVQRMSSDLSMSFFVICCERKHVRIITHNRSFYTLSYLTYFNTNRPISVEVELLRPTSRGCVNGNNFNCCYWNFVPNFISNKATGTDFPSELPGDGDTRKLTNFALNRTLSVHSVAVSKDSGIRHLQNLILATIITGLILVGLARWRFYRHTGNLAKKPIIQ